jgi:hypothetical protein
MRTFVVLRQYPGGLGLQGSLEKEIANLGVVAGIGLPAPSILATDVAVASTGGRAIVADDTVTGGCSPQSGGTSVVDVSRIVEIAVLLHSLDLPARCSDRLCRSEAEPSRGRPGSASNSTILSGPVTKHG